MFTLDSVVPRFPLNCITRNDRDLAICCPNGIYILEDYGLATLKRRYWPLESIEFRAIFYLSSKSSEILALAMDGRSLWIFDGLTGEFRLFWRDEAIIITAIKILKDYNVLLGTFDGRLFRLSDNNLNLLSSIDQPILFIADEDSFVDALGRIYWKSKVILNDGILQPCGLFHSKSISTLFLIKHKEIYAFNTDKETLKSVKLESNSIFCAAALLNDNSLFLATDLGEYFLYNSLEENPLKNLSISEANSEDSESENDTDEGMELESEIVSGTMTPLIKFERIFSVIPNKSNVLVLKVDSAKKRAWIDSIPVDPFESPSNNIIPNFECVQVSCPLCCDSVSQRIPLNSSYCTKGHPITICSITKNVCFGINIFRCRDCNAAYSVKPVFCLLCSGLITK